MKKILALLLTLSFTIMISACGWAETVDLFAQIKDRVFTFSSGVGGWSTELNVGENGAFTGNFHDSEMGETGEGYPNGSMYGCLFHGQFSDPQMIDEYTWTVSIKAEMDEGQVSEMIEDGIRFVTAAPYGVEKAQKVTVFLPGMPVSNLPEDFLIWSHIQEIVPDAKTIPYYAIWNETDEAGFITDLVSETLEVGETVSGGWAIADDPTITDNIMALFDKGTIGLVGVNYHPVVYLGSQIVAGTNHAILCQATVVYPGSQPKYVIIYLYEDLQGNVSILNIADLDIGSLCTYGAEAVDEEEIRTPHTTISGTIDDGWYVLTAKPTRSGEWHADEMEQDNSVVRLASADVQDGVFTARYEPTGDGEASISLRHFNEHNICDEMHTFNLLVRNGKVQEEIGGTYQASPNESEVDPYFSGEWLEKDTQFTSLNVTKTIGDGWDIVITSPISHGAWVIRATAFYDCDYDAFVYADGVKYNLIPGEETEEQELVSGLWGTLRFSELTNGLHLIWYDMQNTENEMITFERAPGLPAYVYTGDDPIEGAIANSLASDEYAQRYMTEPGYVTIPCPIIHKTEVTDEMNAKVYGTFWILNYVKRSDILYAISGGEYPAIITLKKTNNQWRMVDMEEAGDGEDYSKDIERFANGDKGLAEKYYSGADLMSNVNQDIRTRFIKEYVEANGLAIKAYQDYGWDPIALN